MKRRVIRHPRRLAAMLAPVLLLVSCVTENEPQGERVEAGDMLPDFSVTTCDGTTVSAQSLRGKVAAIIFFTTTCPDCREALPEVQRAYDRSGMSADVEFIAIAREEDASAIQRFWDSEHLTIPYSAQPDRSVYNLFAASGVPRIYIADKNGIIIASFGDAYFPDAGIITKIIETYAGQAIF